MTDGGVSGGGERVPERVRKAGDAYFISPLDGPGPGVLLLHSWWGLTDFFRKLADRLADEGYTVLAPDLLDGARPETSAEAEVALGEADMDATAALVLSSVHALRSFSAEPRDPIAVVGFAMGASWALWLSARLPTSIRAVVAYYGTQNVDFEPAVADYLLHVAGDDEVVDPDEVAETRALLGLARRPTEMHTYPGRRHGFVEPDAGTYDEADAERAWARTLEFLRERMG